MSTRNFIGSGQSSPHPLLDKRWIACSVITQGIAQKIIQMNSQHAVTRHARPSHGLLRVGRLLDAQYTLCCYFWMHLLSADCSFNYSLPYSCVFHVHVHRVSHPWKSNNLSGGLFK